METPPARRTLFTTLLGAGVVFLGAMGTVFSLFALLMAVGKPYAVSHTTLLDVLVLFILPPGTLLAGVGLILRHRWARWWIILLAAGLVWLGVKGLITPWDEDPAFGENSGPAAETLQRVRLVQSIACIGGGGAFLLGLLSAPVRREFKRLTENPPP